MKAVHLKRSNGYLVQGKPFTDWNAIKAYMQYLNHDWIEDCGDMSGEVGWHISTEGILKAQQLGYTIFIDGVEIPNATDVVDLQRKIQVAIDAEKERQKQAFLAAEAKREARSDAFNAKAAAWETGMTKLDHDHTDIGYKVLERDTLGSTTITRVVFDTPPMLAGVDGYLRSTKGYDTDYDAYFAPTAIAESFNQTVTETAWLPIKARLLSAPSTYDIASVLALEGISGFTNFLNCVGHVPQERTWLSEPANRTAVLEAFKTSFITEQQSRDPRDYGYGRWYNDDQRICDYLGITAQVEAIWAEGKRRKQKLDEEAAEKRKVEDAKREAEEKIRKTSEAARIVEKTAELGKKSKPQLLAEYAAYIGTTIQKSWAKGKIVDQLAKKLCSAHPQPSMPSQKEDAYDALLEADYY